MGEKPKGYKPVTKERIKEKVKYQHLSDDQAQQLIDVLRQFAYMSCTLLKEIPEKDHERFIRNL